MSTEFSMFLVRHTSTTPGKKMIPRCTARSLRRRVSNLDLGRHSVKEDVGSQDHSSFAGSPTHSAAFGRCTQGAAGFIRRSGCARHTGLDRFWHPPLSSASKYMSIPFRTSRCVRLKGLDLANGVDKLTLQRLSTQNP